MVPVDGVRGSLLLKSPMKERRHFQTSTEPDYSLPLNNGFWMKPVTTAKMHSCLKARITSEVPGLADGESTDRDSLLPPALSESLHIPPLWLPTDQDLNGGGPLAT